MEKSILFGIDITLVAIDPLFYGKFITLSERTWGKRTRIVYQPVKTAFSDPEIRLKANYRIASCDMSHHPNCYLQQRDIDGINREFILKNIILYDPYPINHLVLHTVCSTSFSPTF